MMKTYLRQGQRSVAVRLWNEGRNVEVIAKHIGVEVEVVQKYLENRVGYPLKIICNATRRQNRGHYIPTSKLGGTPSLAPTPVLDRLNEKYGF